MSVEIVRGTLFGRSPSRYGDKWDKRIYAFLKQFEDEGYLVKIPKMRETLEPYPCPRTWDRLARELIEGFDSADDIDGFIGQEVGTKFRAFLKSTVDINELLKEPMKFKALNLDAKYMASVMLSSWVSQHINKPDKAFDLFDIMASESKEYIVIACMCMNKTKLSAFLRQLFKRKKEYADMLSEVVEIKKLIEGS